MKVNTNACSLLVLIGCLCSSFFVTADDGAEQVSAERQSAERQSPISEVPIDDSDRDHWSFRSLRRPAVPQVRDVSWAANEIDCFVLEQLEESGLRPAPQASRALLLRRVKFDLIGLPPTRDELSAFVQDTSPLAYERLVDRLLASPGYGERWGQYWLDLARFSETDGFEHDKLRPEAWKYRQWVVESLNDDMPYDQFVRLQLAGDLLQPKDNSNGKANGDAKDHSIATMFCLAGPDMPDINEQDLRRHDKLNEITSTVGATLLGLQMACAQCHDHKYDPISQADFYRLRAIFESALPQFKRDKPIARLTAQRDPQPSHLYLRGELSGRGPVVEPAPPRIACNADCQWKADSVDPRLAFANWMFEPSNPLVARVIANRTWQHHFGRSLCGNPSDFGIVDTGPTHPELLDWLATELQRSDWSIKAMHRKILLSATYRQASYEEANAKVDRYEDAEQSGGAMLRCIQVDPANRLYGRFPRKRLEGEIIRDAMLAVAGLSNLNYGGPSVMPPLPAELKQTLLVGQWQESVDVSEHFRRSIYVFARRNLRYPIFEVFDRPDAGATCPQRNNSTTALQSLQMLNSDLAVSSARALSERILRETPSKRPTELLEKLFETLFARQPTEVELKLVLEVACDDEVEIGERLFVVCVALLNSNEFIYVD